MAHSTRKALSEELWTGSELNKTGPKSDKTKNVTSLDVTFFIVFLILILCKNNTVEIATDEVSDHDAAVHSENLPSMRLKE